MDDLIEAYPHANIWLTGHSLGGALASLLGATYGFPVVAFEAPGERLAASRLHLPLPPSPSISPLISVSSSDEDPHPAHPHLPITHVYHTSDPIPQGACTGIFSPCEQAGYALETRCHLGKSIVFDTVGKLGWHVDVRTHVIKAVITRLLEDEEVDWGEPSEDDDNSDDDEDEDWWNWIKRKLRFGGKKKSGIEGLGGERKRREVPAATIEEDCVVSDGIPRLVKRLSYMPLLRTVSSGNLVISRSQTVEMVVEVGMMMTIYQNRQIQTGIVLNMVTFEVN